MRIPPLRDAQLARGGAGEATPTVTEPYRQGVAYGTTMIIGPTSGPTAQWRSAEVPLWHKLASDGFGRLRRHGKRFDLLDVTHWIGECRPQLASSGPHVDSGRNADGRTPTVRPPVS